MFVAPAFLLLLLPALFVDPTLLVVASLFEVSLYFYAAGSLIAWGFAYLYLICQIWFPESFIGTAHPGQARTFLELLFLSFTNLSATGLGDVLPIGSAARVLVMVEQFAGVVYIAVVVSRLIGMTIIRHRHNERPRITFRSEE